jgi:hypothetical protein
MHALIQLHGQARLDLTTQLFSCFIILGSENINSPYPQAMTSMETSITFVLAPEIHAMPPRHRVR